MLKRFICLFNLTPIAALAMPLAILLVLTFTVQRSAAQPALNVWSSNGPNAQTYSLVVDPTDLNTIYTSGYGGNGGAGPSGLFKSINNGASWDAANTGLRNSYINSLAIDPGNPNILYAGTEHGVYKTINGGADWSRTNSPVVNIGKLAVAPSNPSIIYAVDAVAGGMLVSTNGGETWITRPLPTQDTSAYFLEVDPQDPSVIYTFMGNFDDITLLKTIDGGVSWTQFSYGNVIISTYAMKIDSRNSNIIYAATWYGVYKSADGGVNWERRGPSRITEALAIDPVNPGTLYVRILEGCCYTVNKSTDDGATWTAFNNGLTNHDVRDLEFDRSGRFLHAATPAGVFSVRVREDAAFVSISGRVTTPDGRGLRNATVFLTDSLGVRRTATTSSFGFYTFDDVRAGDTYVIGVSSRLYRFSSKILRSDSTLADVNFLDFAGEE